MPPNRHSNILCLSLLRNQMQDRANITDSRLALGEHSGGRAAALPALFLQPASKQTQAEAGEGVEETPQDHEPSVSVHSTFLHGHSGQYNVPWDTHRNHEPARSRVSELGSSSSQHHTSARMCVCHFMWSSELLATLAAMCLKRRDLSCLSMRLQRLLLIFKSKVFSSNLLPAVNTLLSPEDAAQNVFRTLLLASLPQPQNALVLAIFVPGINLHQDVPPTC